MNIQLLKNRPEIISLILFGSTARRDSDAYSDKDVFVLCTDLDLKTFLWLKQEIIAPATGERCSVSGYRFSDVMTMAKMGSLFLWHLKLQGKIIFSKSNVIEGIFDSLKSYVGYQQDLECYGELLYDVTSSIKKHGKLNEFDLSLLFTIVRNICMLLCYHEGVPKFGRSNVYLTAKEIFGEKLPVEDWLYPKLCSWKLWYERGIKPNETINDKIISEPIVAQINDLLEFAKRQCV